MRLTNLLIAGLMLATGPASAGVLDAIGDFEKPNLKVGKLELHPYYRLVETYESNIYLQPESHVAGNNANNNLAGPVIGSAITENIGGIKAAFPVNETNKLDLAYEANYRAYAKSPTINNAVHQMAHGMYSYTGSIIKFRAQDTYVNTTDQASSEITRRLKRWQNTGAADVEYSPEGGNLFAGVDGAHVTHKYIADNPGIATALNRYEQTVGGRVGVKVMPQTRVFAGYHRQVIHYTVHQAAPKDSRSHLVDLGVEGVIAPKVTGRVQAGLINRQYDRAPAGFNDRVINTMGVSGQLAYKPLERTEVNLSGSRSLQEATFGVDQYFTASMGALAVNHKFPFKVNAGINGSYEVDKYQNNVTLGGKTAVRRDDVYQGGASLGYDIKEWASVSVAYSYRARFSLFTEQFNYRDQLTSGTLAITF